MNSLSEQQQEYSARPDVRTMPLSQAELKEAQEFDADWRGWKRFPARLHRSPPNRELLIKVFYVG